MPSCALRYCKTRYGKTTEPDLSLFSFPPVNNIAREKWIRFVQIDRREKNWLPSAASKLCSKHFRREDIYFGKTGRIVLKKGSVPCNTNEDDEIYTKATRPESETATLTGVVTPVSVDVSDSESIFDTPRKITLKAQVHKLQKQKICHQAKIKKLAQQNRYLKRTILNLKDFIKELKKKIGIQKNMANSVRASADR